MDPLISSMNTGDCFILDVNDDVYVYQGDKTNNIEKLACSAVANRIKDQDHRGRARVEFFGEENCLLELMLLRFSVALRYLLG